jgi:hypothetical protein
MSKLQAIADRLEIGALPGEFTDAAMMRDYRRVESLFAPGGVVRMPHIHVEVTVEELDAWVEKLRDLWEFFVQTAHPGTITIDGATASGRAYITEFGRMRNGSSHLNYGIYHDRYRRMPDGWKFTERTYEIRYVDTSTLTGSAPPLVQVDTTSRGVGL